MTEQGDALRKLAPSTHPRDDVCMAPEPISGARTNHSRQSLAPTAVDAGITSEINRLIDRLPARGPNRWCAQATTIGAVRQDTLEVTLTSNWRPPPIRGMTCLWRRNQSTAREPAATGNRLREWQLTRAHGLRTMAASTGCWRRPKRGAVDGQRQLASAGHTKLARRDKRRRINEHRMFRLGLIDLESG